MVINPRASDLMYLYYAPRDPSFELFVFLSYEYEQQFLESRLFNTYKLLIGGCFWEKDPANTLMSEWPLALRCGYRFSGATFFSGAMDELSQIQPCALGSAHSSFVTRKGRARNGRVRDC